MKHGAQVQRFAASSENDWKNGLGVMCHTACCRVQLARRMATLPG
jgi:hypothetical protein